MGSIKAKIQSTSKMILIGISILTVLFSIVIIYEFIIDLTTILNTGHGYTKLLNLISPCCYLVILIFTAQTFYKIRKSQTPFQSFLPKRLKILAVLVFIALIISKYIHYLLLSLAKGKFLFSILDETDLQALILAGIIYCLAWIFQYGCMLQEENDGIL